MPLKNSCAVYSPIPCHLSADAVQRLGSACQRRDCQHDELDV